MKKTEIEETIKELQSDIIADPDAPKKYSSEYGDMTLVEPVDTKIHSVPSLFRYIKQQLKMKETSIIEMMSFKMTDLKKQLGTKTIDDLKKKKYIYTEEKSPYYSLKKK
jgi:hypothetical protein